MKTVQPPAEAAELVRSRADGKVYTSDGRAHVVRYIVGRHFWVDGAMIALAAVQFGLDKLRAGEPVWDGQIRNGWADGDIVLAVLQSIDGVEWIRERGGRVGVEWAPERSA